MIPGKYRIRAISKIRSGEALESNLEGEFQRVEAEELFERLRKSGGYKLVTLHTPTGLLFAEHKDNR
jgi:hypothetical protein